MLDHLTNLFFPKVCLGCESFLLENEGIICTECRHELPLTQHLKISENEAFHKFYGKIPIEFAATLVYFHKKGRVQNMLHGLKYKGFQEVGTFFGEWLGDELINFPKAASIDAIIPVPLHPKRLKERGYNQVETFGLALAQCLGKTYDDSLLYRKIYSNSQVRKNHSERSKLNQEVFDVTFTEQHQGQHFLLIDDILTTGATLEACSRALLQIPNVKISVVCMAMSYS